MPFLTCSVPAEANHHCLQTRDSSTICILLCIKIVISMCLCVLVKMQPAFLGAHPSATFNIVGKKILLGEPFLGRCGVSAVCVERWGEGVKRVSEARDARSWEMSLLVVLPTQLILSSTHYSGSKTRAHTLSCTLAPSHTLQTFPSPWL